ncbi:hypothetical protein ABZ671_02745 [Micromonospora sp. NPDC006766]|uniref:hypothetical protein n=1 Tax=Micromonospora sp. NPDC006766 TaxID=3154778 RepID=UPI0033EC0BD4
MPAGPVPRLAGRILAGLVLTYLPPTCPPGAVEVVWSATTDFQPNTISLLMLGGWIVLLAGVAGWAYRRDEGRRFT